MTHPRWLFAIAVVVAAMSTSARASAIRDQASMFSPDVVKKAQAHLDRLERATHIPVVIENALTELPDIYYVLAWNFKQEILRRNQALIEKGVEFYFPVNPPE